MTGPVATWYQRAPHVNVTNRTIHSGFHYWPCSRLQITRLSARTASSPRESPSSSQKISVLCSPIKRRPPGDPPGRAVVDRRLPRIDEAPAEFRMLHLLPETAVMQMGIVQQRLRRAHRTPGEAALLGGVVNLLRRQAGDEVGEQIVDDVRCVRRDDRRDPGIWDPSDRPPCHSWSIRSARFLTFLGLSPPDISARHINAILGTELGARRRTARHDAGRSGAAAPRPDRRSWRLPIRSSAHRLRGSMRRYTAPARKPFGTPSAAMMAM